MSEEHTRLAFSGAGGDEVFARSWPGEEGAPGILLVHGAHGLGTSLDAYAGRIKAELGWSVLAPDLHSREQPEGDPLEAWLALPDRRALADLEQGLRALQEGGADTGRLAVIGFGTGGCLAFLLGCTSHRLAAVVDHQGPIVYGELSREKTTEPLELALGLEAPLLAHFGQEDPGIPVDHVEQLERQLSAFAKPFELVVHPGAGPGFCDPRSPAWDEALEARAWERTRAFLGEVLDALEE